MYKIARVDLDVEYVLEGRRRIINRCSNEGLTIDCSLSGRTVRTELDPPFQFFDPQ
jgi:hypothetical protein